MSRKWTDNLPPNPTVPKVVSEYIKYNHSYCIVYPDTIEAGLENPEDICACHPSEANRFMNMCDNCLECVAFGGHERKVSIREIIKQFMELTDYDSLCWSDGYEACGCSGEDMFACDEDSNASLCRFGYLHKDGMVHLEKGAN